MHEGSSRTYRSNTTTGASGWFKEARKTAGVRDFPWHDLRCPYASRLAVAWVDIRTVQELMGHNDIQVTLRYAHLLPQHQLEAVQRLCNTGVARNEPTDTKTSTSDFAEAEPIVASQQ